MKLEDERSVYPHAASAAITLAIVLMVTVCVLCSSGCAPVSSINQARTQYEVNETYVGKNLGEPAHGIAEDNADAWAVQLNALDGTPVPVVVLERMQKYGVMGE